MLGSHGVYEDSSFDEDFMNLDLRIHFTTLAGEAFLIWG